MANPEMFGAVTRAIKLGIRARIDGDIQTFADVVKAANP
jgi:hypothetical protein